jgi:hypothetical protein
MQDKTISYKDHAHMLHILIEITQIRIQMINILMFKYRRWYLLLKIAKSLMP